MIWGVGIALAAVLVFWASYDLSERRRRPMDAAGRAAAAGRFANLPGGTTHYRWDGPEHGPVAVCVHGLSSDMRVWDALAPILTRMGFRVLRYDLYGRGFSDRVAGVQDSAFFMRQLRELLDDQNLTEAALLIGHSMGGAIVTAFAADTPDRVDRMVLLAPSGLGHNVGRLGRFAIAVPVLGDWAMRLFGGPEPVRGTLPARLSSLRHMLTEDMEPAHRAVVAAGIPVLAIWGEDDPAIPLTAVGRLARINRNAHQVTVPGAAHMLLQTHPDDVHKALQTFLRDG